MGLFLNRTSSCRAIDQDLEAPVEAAIDIGIDHDVTFVFFENEVVIFLVGRLVLDGDYFGMTASNDVMFHFFGPAIDSDDGFVLSVNLGA